MKTNIIRMVARLYHLIDDNIYRARVKRLIARGLVLGKNVSIGRTALIDNAYPYLISIGNNCSIAEHVRIHAHDAATFKFTDGHTRLGKVEIKDNCFIGERSMILPGVTIGPNVLVAAGSVVHRDIRPNSCVAGLPARLYGKFDDFIERNKRQIRDGTVFEVSDLLANLDQLDKQTKDQVWESVQGGRHAYVKGGSRERLRVWNKV